MMKLVKLQLFEVERTGLVNMSSIVWVESLALQKEQLKGELQEG